MCVTLTSPQMPGVPHGMVTWGVMVHVDNFVAMEPPPPPSNSDPTLIAEQITGPIPTWAPVESSSLDVEVDGVNDNNNPTADVDLDE